MREDAFQAKLRWLRWLRWLRYELCAIEVRFSALLLDLAIAAVFKGQPHYSGTVKDATDGELSIALPLAAIESVMKRTVNITEDAAKDHLQTFKVQMREKFGIGEITLYEPYLPIFLRQREVAFLKSRKHKRGHKSIKHKIKHHKRGLTPGLSHLKMRLFLLPLWEKARMRGARIYARNKGFFLRGPPHPNPLPRGERGP